MANSSMIKRLEKLEQAGTPGNPPPAVPDGIKVFMETFGGRPEDYWVGDHWMTLEELVSAANEMDPAHPETAGGNTDDTPAGTESRSGA